MCLTALVGPNSIARFTGLLVSRGGPGVVNLCHASPIYLYASPELPHESVAKLLTRKQWSWQAEENLTRVGCLGCERFDDSIAKAAASTSTSCETEKLIEMASAKGTPISYYDRLIRFVPDDVWVNEVDLPTSR